MKLLLDTHTLLYWAFDSPELSRRAGALIADRSNTILVSSASVWEVATKHRLGRLAEASALVRDMSGWFERVGLVELPITVEHAQRAGSWHQAHRDPFDRMLAAQSVLENVPILGKDRALEEFGVQRVW